MQIIEALKALHQKATSKAAASGSIAGVIAELSQNWPTSESVTIDATLTKEGKAADAKAVGDQLKGKSPASHTHTASQITDLPPAPTAATTAKAGLVKQAVNVAAAAGETPTKAEFNNLITALKNAGIMADS